PPRELPQKPAPAPPSRQRLPPPRHVQLPAASQATSFLSLAQLPGPSSPAPAATRVSCQPIHRSLAHPRPRRLHRYPPAPHPAIQKRPRQHGCPTRWRRARKGASLLLRLTPRRRSLFLRRRRLVPALVLRPVCPEPPPDWRPPARQWPRPARSASPVLRLRSRRLLHLLRAPL